MTSSVVQDPALAPSSAAPPVAPGGERCPSCGAPRPGRFCADCGERRVDAEDYALRHFLQRTAEHLTNLDGSVPRTLVGLWRPGFLAREYFDGRRRSYLWPLQVFLLVSLAIFFLLPGTGLLRWGLDQYLRTGTLRGAAQALALREEAALHLSRAELVLRFDQALWAQKRTVLLALVPAFALVTFALERTRGRARVRRWYVEHLVFAIHFFAFWLSFLAALLGAFVLLGFAAQHGAPLLRPMLVRLGTESGLTLVISTALFAWLHGGHRVFFARGRLGATLSAGVCTLTFWWLFMDVYQTLAVMTTFLFV